LKYTPAFLNFPKSPAWHCLGKGVLRRDYVVKLIFNRVGAFLGFDPSLVAASKASRRLLSAFASLFLLLDAYVPHGFTMKFPNVGIFQVKTPYFGA